jgi:acyl dehydratase
MNQRIINSLEELRGLTGQEVVVGDWFTVTQTLINAFAEVMQDYQWIHTDVERARKELPQGKTIAHGFLTLSLLSRLLKQALVLKVEFKQGINYGFNRIRFPTPVPAESEIRVRCTLQKFEEVPGGIQLGWGVTVEAKDAPKPALVAEWLVRYYR